MPTHPAVSPLTSPLPRRLRRAGWIVVTPGGGSKEPGCLSLLALLLAVMWWIGAVALIFSFVDPRSGLASLLALGTAGLALPIWAVGYLPERTTTGERLLRAARHRTPARVTTPDEAALSVALWGGSALWAIDAGFAGRYRVARTGDRAREDAGPWSAGGSPDGGADSAD